MTIPTRARLPGIKKGDVITANPFLNSIINQLNRGLDDFEPPTQVEQALVEGQESEKPFARMKIVSESDDSLLCFDAASNLVRVAKPLRLQGATATRTVSSEAQIIIEPYTTGQFIFAFRDIDGGTNTSDPLGTVLLDYMDLNVDGRMWAEDT